MQESAIPDRSGNHRRGPAGPLYRSTDVATFRPVGLARIELATSTLSVWRSNQLSYSPEQKSLRYRSGGGQQNGVSGFGPRSSFLAGSLTPRSSLASDVFLFQHGDSHTAHEVGDQVE
jgi:hypothetical protein